MKNLKTSLVLGAIALVSVFYSNAAMADMSSTYRVAVVNVPVVVESSKEVLALKKEQQAKTEELQKWLKTVKANVDKQSKKETKEALIKKYDAEFMKKQEAIRENYTKKLQAIDKNITAIIEQERKAMGYNIVLAKGTVLSGGDDITAYIVKKVK